MQPLYWVLVFIVLLLIEAATLGLTTIWFAAGALVAFLAGLLGAGIVVQIGIFLAVSVLLFVVTRPIALRHFNNNRDFTNWALLIGKPGVVVEEVDTLKGKGQVEVDGEIWSAKTKDPEEVISEGTVVTVETIQGVKMVVRKKEEPS